MNLEEQLGEPPTSSTCGVAYYFKPLRSGRCNELEIAKRRHRSIRPSDILHQPGCPVFIDCCCLDDVFRSNRESSVEVETSLYTACGVTNGRDAYPIIAYSKDPKKDKGGRAVPEETKSWKLGVLLYLSRSMTVVCDAVYNKDLALVISESMHDFGADDDLSLRFLNRIKADSCADDGMISCSTGGPDTVASWQLPPPVLLRMKQRRLSSHRMVSLEGWSVAGKKKKKINRLDKSTSLCDSKPTKRRRVGRHRVVNAHIRKKRLDKQCYLFPYVPREGKDVEMFARIETDRFDPLLDSLGESPYICDYNNALESEAYENISLRCLEVGDGMSIMNDPGKADGEIDSDVSDPEDRTGRTVATWLPVKNTKTNKEPTTAELDELVPVDEIVELIRTTYPDDSKRKSVKSRGMNQYAGTHSVAQKPTPRLGQSNIRQAHLYREGIDPTFLPVALNVMATLAQDSIDSARLADPTYHYLLFDVFDEAISGNDLKKTPKLGELMTRLQLLTGPGRRRSDPRGFVNTNHGDGSDDLGLEFSKKACEYMSKILEICREDRDLKDRVFNVAKSVVHVLRSGHAGGADLSTLKFSVKASCGYLCRWREELAKEDAQVLAHFAYTEAGTAVRIGTNRIMYNLFDSQLEHQTSYPVVVQGDRVHLNHPLLSILAWGCGKSDRRKWWDANVTPNSTGRFTLQHFIREVVNHNVQQQAMTAGLISQEDLNAWLSDNGD